MAKPFLVPRPLPEDPVLADCAATLDDSGHWAQIVDPAFRILYTSAEMRLSFGDTGPVSMFPTGVSPFSAEFIRFGMSVNRGEHATVEPWRARFSAFGPYVLATTPGGREQLRREVPPDLVDLVDELQPKDPPAVFSGWPMFSIQAGIQVEGATTWFRIDADDGRIAGFCAINIPAAGMSHLAELLGTADLAHLERSRVVQHPGRHPAAILMADLEASSQLARRLSTAQYFTFVRRLVRAADRCIVDAGGIVGRHAGDGIVAFFLAETNGSESAAAMASISAANALRSTLTDVAARSELADTDLHLRFGPHWGATLYMGRILTAGRSEVTALGDEVNETARIEACATGGRTLASKALIERLDLDDADTLGIDTAHITYKQLADLDTATNKARRDAPAIAVCEI